VAGMNITAGKLLRSVVPHGLVQLSEARRLRSSEAYFDQFKAIIPFGLARMVERRRQRLSRARFEPFGVNSALRNRHAGARCFILCTGPSVRKQDLRRLAGELVISVSSAYLHPDFRVFKPAYHCVPQITYGKMTEDDVIGWFRDMHAHAGDAEMVLSSTERALVESRGLFAGRRVHYLALGGDIAYADGGAVPDLTGPLPGPQSVPVMALMLALYLGCKTIYLLGTEHDHFVTGTYNYFYDRSPVSGKDLSVTGDGKVAISRYDELHAFARLWRQYRWLRSCASSAGATIYNATAGGALDEFERVDFGALELAGDATDTPAVQSP
jgi:hypothetical protein